MLHTETVVIGGGIAGLVAAQRHQDRGEQVLVLEAGSDWGGVVQGAEIAGVRLDTGAEAFAVRTDAVAELARGLGLDVVAPNPAGSWLQLPGRAVPAPRLGVLGIPGDLDAPEVAEALGDTALERARADLTAEMAPWTERLGTGAPVTLGELVADRLGDAVLATLVAPVASGVHSADPYRLEIRSVAPGLLEAAVEQGSLTRAVAAQRARRPGAAVASLVGGMNTLTQALAARTEGRLNTAVTGLQRLSNGWEIQTTTDTFRAERLVMATDGPTAWRLLAPLSDGALHPQDAPEQGAGVALVTLILDHPELDSEPRGTGILVAPTVSREQIGAKAMTHISAKWSWVREALPVGRHAVRLSYGRVTDDPASGAPGYASSDAELRYLATRDVALLTGTAPGVIVAQHVQRWRAALPVASAQHRRRVSDMRDWARTQDDVDVVGAWLAGTGLAAVIADIRG
ncbi:MAG: protoporphyrinogen/coproporphyrinogen oxidase [Micrococcaceae bacterium]